MSLSLLLVNDFPPVVSGIATFFHQIWRRLPPGRTEIAAPLMPGARKVDDAMPCPVHRLPLPLGEGTASKALKTAIPALWTFRRILDAAPGRLHCGQVLSSGVLGLFCSRTFGIPYVVYVYGSETVRFGARPRLRDLMLTVLGNADVVVTNSDATSAEFAAFGVDRPRIRRIYPGVDPDAFRPAAKDPAIERRLGLEGRRVLLTVARLDQRKGHDAVIRALRQLPEDVVYLIAGRGREEARLRTLAAETGVEARVRFLGFVADADLPALYNACDVFVMPNRVTEGTSLAGDVEGFGISFLEAGACGKPVVAGRSGGAVEAVVDEETGLLVDPRSDEAVAAAASRLLRDADLSARMGLAARRRVETCFDWRLLARQVEEIL